MGLSRVLSLMLRYKLIGVLILCSLCFSRAAWSQHWTQLTIPTTGLFVTPYFVNANVGFTFNAGIYISAYIPSLEFRQPSLTRTTDGGLTWAPIPFFDSSGCSISQLCFVTLQHGYAATLSKRTNNGQADAGGIYETVDQGLHWKKITPDGMEFTGVYATPGAIFASEIRDSLAFGEIDFSRNDCEIIFSYNDGATWDSINNVTGVTLNQQHPQFQWIYGNRDSLVATVYNVPHPNSVHDVYLVYSTDLGISWQSTLLDNNYDWDVVALHISPHSCTIIRQFLTDLNEAGDTYSFLEAVPPYTTWNPSLMNLETGAWIAGNSCAMYLSYAGQDLNQGPLQRSTDNGSTWQSDGIGHSSGTTPDMNEIDDVDWQNLSVVGYGSIVNAEGVWSGGLGLWRTTDGGDGSLSAKVLAPRIEFEHGPFKTGNDTLVISNCSSSSSVVYYQNLACAITKLVSISIAGLSLSEYSMNSTNHNDCLSLPDTTYVTFTIVSTGTYPITVNAHFVDDEYNTIDTALNFTLLVEQGGTSIPLSLDIKPTSIITQPGDTISIPVYLSGNATLGATSITLPFGLDTNVLQPVGFFPAITGITVGSIVYSGGTGTVPLQADSLVLSGETLIGTLRCIVYLSDTLATSVTLAGASLTSANSPCVALSLTTDSMNIAITGCGTATLLQFMKTGKIPLSIKSIAPNPAAGFVDVIFDNPASEAISYQVIDVLGNVRAEGNVSGDEITLDIHSLPNGLYYLRSRDVGAGAAVSGRFMVER